MKQVLTSARTGELDLVDVPPPALVPGGVRVRTAASLLSAGTERMILDLASKSALGKAHARPDLVRQVLGKAKADGLAATWRTVQSRLDKPMPLGYSAAGVVESVADGVAGLAVGDRVAVAGAGYANHAEVNAVPRNLVARVPDGVSMEDACYATVGAIALQGVRLARPELGDTVVVVGLGLIGLLTVQLLKANGCRVFGTDPDASRLALGRRLGLDDGAAGPPGDVARAVERFTGGRGADATLLTAATESDGPIELAAAVTRRKGQVVAVGAVGLNIPRAAFFQKELGVQVSMSTGPGRYDRSYEEGGVDYPYDYVRWTEQRNLGAVLRLMADGKLDVAALTTHVVPFARALDAYALIQSDEPHVGVVLRYDTERPQPATVRVTPPEPAPDADPGAAPRAGLAVGFAGAGNHAALHLLPHLARRDDVRLKTLVTATGLSARAQAERFQFEQAATDVDAVLADDAVDAVFVATRHATHADFAARALSAGKAVFVEKPLVATEPELEAVIAAYRAANEAAPTPLVVGLNRRFAPLAVAMKAALPGGPRQMLYRVNAGAIPTTTWLHEPAEGGGMLVGEMVHFLDLMQMLSAERPVRVFAESARLGRADRADADNVSVTVRFDGGSVGTLVYSTSGDRAVGKERVEVFAGGATAVLDDFRALTTAVGGRRDRRKAAQDKGHRAQVDATVDAFRRAASPIPFGELVDGMRMVFAARRSLASGLPEPVEPAADGAS